MSIEDEDFTYEVWADAKGKVLGQRFTKGCARKRLPWYRRLLMKLIGRSHVFRQQWHHVTIQQPTEERKHGPDQPTP